MSQGQAAEATCPGLAVCRAMLLREAVETLAAEVRRDRAVGAKRLAPTPPALATTNHRRPSIGVRGLRCLLCRHPMAAPILR